MPQTKTVSEILGRGVAFEAHEAVAVAQQLILGEPNRDDLAPPFGPPAIENVEIRDDGCAVCRHCGSTPAVSEIGALLDGMLPRQAFTRVPGGLRYTIARARSEVDAPPFDSIHALSAALERYERGDRREVVGALATRVADSEPALASPEPQDAGVEGPIASVEPPLSPIDMWPARDRRRAAGDRRNPPARPTPSIAPSTIRLATNPAPAAPPTVPPPTIAAASIAPIDIVYNASSLSALPVVRRRRSIGSWLVFGAAAAALSFSAAYVGVLHYRIVKPQAPLPAHEAVDVSRTTTVAPVIEPEQTISRTERRDTVDAVVPAAPRSDAPMFSPAFASNGTAIFYHTGRSADARSALAEKPLDNDLQVMTILDDGWKNYHVQPSPDGTRIAFDSDRDGTRGIYVAGRDGSDVHRISGPGYAAVPTWSPDGAQLAFVRGETDKPRVWNLWLTTLESGQTRRLTDFRYGQTWGASWFPDGSRVAYTHEDRLVVLTLADGQRKTYASPVKGRLVRTAAVSPDGQHVIFQVTDSGAWLLDLSDGSMRRVLTDPTAEEFAWAPDGRRVAFHSRRDGQWGIWIMAP